MLEITGKRSLLSHNIAGSICYLWEARPRGERALHFLTIRPVGGPPTIFDKRQIDLL